jgi:hypothetical protein
VLAEEEAVSMGGMRGGMGFRSTGFQIGILRTLADTTGGVRLRLRRSAFRPATGDRRV